METIIKKINSDDVNALHAVARQTFMDAFGSDNTPENMQHYLAEHVTIPRLLTELNNGESMFYLAMQNEKVIGYLKLNTGAAQTEPMGEDALEIERIYTLQEFYGKQVGHQLFQQAIEVAKQHQAAFIWLGVWEQNERAIRFYQKNGFVTFGKHQFKLGDDLQTDILMRLDM